MNATLLKEFMALSKAEQLAKLMELQALADAAQAAEEARKAKSAPTNLCKASSILKPCAAVHRICNANPGATRKAILAICDAEGIAYYTARTQYQLWAKQSKAASQAIASQAAVAAVAAAQQQAA